MSSQLETGFLFFAARSALTNRATSFWRLNSSYQLVLNLEPLFKVFSWEIRGGGLHVRGDVGTFLPFFIFLMGVCLFTSPFREGLQHDHCCWCPCDSRPPPKSPCLGAVNVPTAGSGNGPLQPSVRETRATHSMKKGRAHLPAQPLPSAPGPYLSTQTSKSYYPSPYINLCKIYVGEG